MADCVCNIEDFLCYSMDNTIGPAVLYDNMCVLTVGLSGRVLALEKTNLAAQLLVFT